MSPAFYIVVRSYKGASVCRIHFISPLNDLGANKLTAPVWIFHKGGRINCPPTPLSVGLCRARSYASRLFLRREPRVLQDRTLSRSTRPPDHFLGQHWTTVKICPVLKGAMRPTLTSAQERMPVMPKIRPQPITSVERVLFDKTERKSTYTQWKKASSEPTFPTQSFPASNNSPRVWKYEGSRS